MATQLTIQAAAQFQHSVSTNRAWPTDYFFQHRSGASLQTTLTSIANELRDTSRSQGWVLVIGAPHSLTKHQLEIAGIRTQRVIVIARHQVSDLDTLLRDALTCSTCQAVITFFPEDDATLADYAYLARKYQTKLLNHGLATGDSTPLTSQFRGQSRAAMVEPTSYL